MSMWQTGSWTVWVIIWRLLSSSLSLQPGASRRSERRRAYTPPTMNEWSRERPQEPEPPQDEIPLLSPVGSYSKPWYKKHGWILGPFVIVLVLILGAAIITPALTGSPDVKLRLKAIGPVPLSLSPSSLQLKHLPKDQDVELVFSVTNKSTRPALIHVQPRGAGPSGVTSNWLIDGQPALNGSVRVEANSTVPGKLVVNSKNTDSSGFDIDVFFETEFAP